MALGRFVLALAALDAGSAFGGMGSSREVAISALVEPALLLALAGAALAAGSTDLGVIAHGRVARRARPGSRRRCCWRAGAFAIVAVAETGHEPVDNPDTHLELTMIHEGMLLEASGPRLAILMYAAELKLVLVAGLFAAAFLPMGTGRGPRAALAPRRGRRRARQARRWPPSCSALLDATLAKLRILALPGLLATASIVALVGLATRLWLPA